MLTRLTLLAAFFLLACVRGDKAGPYPYGFQAFGHQHYFQHDIGRLMFGPNDQIHGEREYYWDPRIKRWVFAPSVVTLPNPLAKGWVVTDKQGRVYVSPELQHVIRK